MTTDIFDAERETELPAGMALVRDFVNTIDYDDETDALTSRPELTTFLHEAGLLVRRTPSSDDELALARRLRTGLREALELNHTESLRPLPELDAVLAQLPMRLHWGDGSPAALVPAVAGIAGALAQVAVAVSEAVADDTWSRLKICSDDGCAWAYYDTSKNRSKNWCGVTCGNKAKTRAYRARKRSGAT